MQVWMGNALEFMALKAKKLDDYGFSLEWFCFQLINTPMAKVGN